MIFVHQRRKRTVKPRAPKKQVIKIVFNCRRRSSLATVQNAPMQARDLRNIFLCKWPNSTHYFLSDSMVCFAIARLAGQQKKPLRKLIAVLGIQWTGAHTPIHSKEGHTNIAQVVVC